MESIYLQGSETVADASASIRNSADTMLRAANMMEDCTRRLEFLFGQGYGSNLDKLIEELSKLPTK